MQLSKWDQYGKSIIAFLFVIWSVVAPLWFGDRHIDSDEVVVIGLAVLNNALVYIVPLTPRFKGVKTVVNALIMAFTAASPLLYDGLQPNDWTIIIGAGLAIFGVTIAPAASLKEREPVQVGTGLDN